MSLIDEIRQQPAAAQRVVDGSAEVIGRLAAALAGRRPSFVVIAARGSSDHAAVYAQYLLATRNSLAVALATPSAITLYGARPSFKDGLVVGISQSGRSPDIVAVLEAAQRQGAPTVALVNDAGSPLAAAADEVVDLLAGPELATAATKTYTTELLAVALLSFALDPPSAHETATFRRAPDRMAEALSADDRAHELAQRPGLSRCIVLGRGFAYATAREWALKLQELANIHALPFSSADFEHGPLALAEAGLDVLAVAPAGPSFDAQAEVLRRLRGEFGARVIAISDSPAAAGVADVLPMPSGIPDWLTPAVSIVAGQLFAYHLTRAKGLDPDSPRTISKVTETR